MPHLPATDANSDDYHPMEGPRIPPAPDPDPLLLTVQTGDFQTLQRSLCEEALSRHDNSLHGDRCRGVILEPQNVIPQEVRNFDFPYSSTERLGRRQGVTRRTFGSSINNNVIISKQYNRSDFQRAEVELAITSGSDTIIEVIGVIWNQHKVQVLQKRFNGVTLTQLLKTRYQLNDDEVHLLTYKMLCFLKDLHGRNILHRNIDPDHIMISRTDQRICVVGCSALCNINDCTSEFFRTPYSSPEVARGEDHGYKTDVFSLGCTMLSAVSGKIPYFGTDRQQIALNGILHKIAIGEFPVDTILSGMDTQTLLCQMISDMTKYPQEERLSLNELLEKYYSHGEPAWENCYYHPHGTAAPVVQYRTTPEPTSSPLSDQWGTRNIPSSIILESSSDNEEESGEEREGDGEERGEIEGEGEKRGEELPPKPPSDHFSDSGRQTISEIMPGPCSGIDDYAEIAGNNLGIHHNIGSADTEGFYTIKVKEHERLVCEVKCQFGSFGRDLQRAVNQKMKAACILKYENRVIRFDCKLQNLFPLNDVTVTMERTVQGRRLVPRDDDLKSSDNFDEGGLELDQTGEIETWTSTGSDTQDDMSSLTTMAGDVQMFTRREVLVAEQAQVGGELLEAEPGQDDGEPLVVEEGPDDGELLVAEPGQDDREPLVAEPGQGDGKPLVVERGQDDRETLVAEQRHDDGEPLVAEPGQDDGEPLVVERCQDDREPLVAKQGQDDELLVAEPGQVDGEPLVVEPGHDDGQPLVAEGGQNDGQPLVAEGGQDDREPLVAEQGQVDGEPLMVEGQEDLEPLVAEPQQDPSKADEKNDKDDSGCVCNLEISDLSISDTSQLSEDICSPMSDE